MVNLIPRPLKTPFNARNRKKLPLRVLMIAIFAMNFIPLIIIYFSPMAVKTASMMTGLETIAVFIAILWLGYSTWLLFNVWSEFEYEPSCPDCETNMFTCSEAGKKGPCADFVEEEY